MSDADNHTAAHLFDQAESAFRKGQWHKALCHYAGVVDAVDGALRPRFRIADSLLNLGRRDLAVSVYKAIASHALNAGFPLFGLIATKMVLLLEPDNDEALAGAANLYARGSAALVRHAPHPPAPQPHGERASVYVDEDGVLERIAKRAVRFERTTPSPLPPLPLLSFLPEEAFIAVLSQLKLRRFADEEVIIREGERSDSFYIVADGEVLVRRDIEDEDGGITLAHLHRGSIFGELALISDEPRHASVVAKGDVDVLEITRGELIVAAAHDADIADAVKQFTRERFLRNLTATHPFFSVLTRQQRHDVMDIFRIATCAKGETLIREGEPGPGLFLLLGGTASVSKRAHAEQRVHLATLRGGDVCGEMSLVGDQATQATVTAEEHIEALFLSREAFKATVREHPELMRYLATLTDERLRQNRALLHAKGLLEDDEHIMV